MRYLAVGEQIIRAVAASALFTSQALLAVLFTGVAAASPACDAARESYDELRARSTMNEAQYANTSEAGDVARHCRGLPAAAPRAVFGIAEKPPGWYEHGKRSRHSMTRDVRKEAHAAEQPMRPHRGPRPPVAGKPPDGAPPPSAPPVTRSYLPAR